MELQDKVVDSREAVRTEQQERDAAPEQGEAQVETPVDDRVVTDAIHERRGKLVTAIRDILNRQLVEIGGLQLPPLQTRALEALKTAVDGRSAGRGAFVFASDRRDLLEQALGVLQPDLADLDHHAGRELHAELVQFTDRIGSLRHKLSQLEDSQDELLEAGQKEALEAAAAPTDKPKPKPQPSDPDAPRPATTLTGPDLPPERTAPSTLTGPDLPPERTAPSTLTGPDLPAERPAPSTLTGPDLPPERPAPSTLAGDDLPAAPAAASTLGDDPTAGADPPGDSAAAATTDAAKAKRPWWRRPFG